MKRVLGRDNYTCKCCGADRSGDLIVHHLDGYNWCIEKRTDETNGVTLCNSCHKNFHSKYGTGNNTKEQFYEWFGQAVELVKYNDELPSARKVYCYEENKIYDSAVELAKAWNYKHTHIYDCCNRKKRNNNNGYIKSIKGKHLVWYDEWESWTVEQKEEWKKWAFRKKKNGEKKIICLETGVVYESGMEAQRQTGINNSNISQCCKGKLKSAGGYHWMYYDDYLKLDNT